MSIFAPRSLKKLLRVVVSLSLISFAPVLAPSAHATVTLDMTGVTVTLNHTTSLTGATNFGTGYVNIKGTGTANGDIVRYNSVATKSGTTIDMVVTTNLNSDAKTLTAISGNGTTVTYTTAAANGYVPGQIVTVAATTPSGFGGAKTIASVIDSTHFTVTNSTSGSASAFTTVSQAAAGTITYDSGTDTLFNLQMTPASPNTGVGLRFAFYEHGTYTGVNTGTEVVLQNLNMWVDDLDTIASTDYQFAAFSGFQSYNLNKRAAGACTGGNTSIIYNASTNPRCDDANLNVNPVPGTNQIRFTSTHGANGSNIPQDRASVLYSSVSSVDVTLGDVLSGNGAIYAISFSPPSWGTYGSVAYSNGANTPPVITGTVPTLRVQSNNPTVFALSDFGTYYDFDANPFDKIEITTLPGSGTLQRLVGASWVGVSALDTITASDVGLGKLRFTGSSTTSFTFRPNDSLAYSTSAYTLNIAVTAQGQTITFANPGSKLTTAGTFASNAVTNATGLAVSLESKSIGVCTVNNTTLEITVVAAGTCTIIATQAGNATYATATPVTQSFVVSNLTAQVITFNNPGDKVLSGTPFASGAVSNASPTLVVAIASTTLDVCTTSGLNITTIALGRCSITASQAGDATRAQAANVTQVFNVVGASYTVTYHAGSNGTGSVPSPVTSSMGWTISGNTGPLVYAGHDFNGWNTNSSGTGGTAYSVNQSVTPVADVDLYPTWVSTPTHTVAYALNSGTSSLPTQADVAERDTFTAASTPTRAGYSFTGWSDGGSGSYTAGSTVTMSTSNITLTAQWTLNPTHTVTYSLNGGDSSLPTQAAVAEGLTFTTASTPTKTGYDFVKWRNQLGTDFSAGVSYTMGAGNVTLTAQWTAKTYSYSISYLPGANGTGSMATSSGTSATFNLPASTFTPNPGYFFAGWLDASNHAYIDEQALSLTSSLTLVLTAQWSASAVTKYILTYSTNGGGAAPTAENHAVGDILLNDGSALSQVNYQFTGWRISGSDYLTGSLFHLIADDTATAIWVYVPPTSFTVASSAGSHGSISPSGSNTVNTGDDAHFTITPDAHYSVATLTVDGALITNASSYTFSNVQADHTIAVTFALTVFSITYNTNSGGTAPSPSTGTYNTQLALNSGSTLSKAGYNFGGWLLGGNIYEGSETYTVTYSLTASAVWNEATYVISYEGNGGDGGQAPGNYTTGDPAYVVADGSGFTKDGYTFGAWTSTRDDASTIVATYSGTSNILLHALWNVIGVEYTITYSGNGNTSGTAPDSATATISINLASNDGSLAKSGFTFGGWNTRADGSGQGYAEGAIYPLVADSTVYAIWTAINSGGGGGGGSAPAPIVEKPEPEKGTKIIKKVVISVARIIPATNAPSTGTPTQKTQTSGTTSTNGNVIVVKSNSESAISVKSVSEVPQAEVNVGATVSPSVHVEQSDSGVVVSTTNGWTGRLQVAAVTTTDNVESDKSSIEIVVNPDAASNTLTTPKTLQNASVQWSPSPSQVVGYEVTVNGNVECKTVSTSCALPVAIGPKSKVEVTAIGNDQTTSIPVLANVKVDKPIPAIVVNFATNSAVLSAKAKADLRAVAKVIQETGYTSLVVAGHTDAVGKNGLNQPLSIARANSTSAYLTKLLPGVEVAPAGFSKAVPVASNSTDAGKAANRRAEVSVR
jgi:uncharacterized repeat protein (TIGR02543 family)